jgi:hypothetical protein
MDKRYNKFKPKKDTTYSYGTMEQSNKSAESATAYIETVYGTKRFKRALILNDEASIIDLMDDYSDAKNESLQSRISEMEKQNSELREALERIANTTDGNNPGHAVFYFTAKQALNHKDNV